MEAEKFKAYNAKSIASSPYWSRVPEEIKGALASVSKVLPFRTNEYVLRELIAWDSVPDDPVFRLTFPHPDMLPREDYSRLRELLSNPSNEAAASRYIATLRHRMNPHPAGQMTHNVPTFDGRPLPGLQHKYKETVLFFPAAGQTCHAYCTFCFRWPQFIGAENMKFNARESDELIQYLLRHPEVTDVLITGGDPMVMNAESLAGYIEPLLLIPHLQNIRIGTKSVSYWPQRFVTDKDADALMRLFERVVGHGKNLSIMAHYNHPAELRPELAKRAIKRITGTGATVRMQSPVVRHINDSSEAWQELWTTGVRLGAIPYYMFVERDTGPQRYFELPLAEAYEIFKAAYQGVSGLSRTVRGPSMSTLYGKVVVDGIATIGNEKVFVLQFLQARNPDWVRTPFFAKFDPAAVWFDELQPAFGESAFFFQNQGRPASRQPVYLHRDISSEHQLTLASQDDDEISSGRTAVSTLRKSGSRTRSQ
ncbi:KamA family radical SAM protein [Paraburkholderia ferrariae]|uniref:KamA family radical SAM protein n=1 Tax=Paraburkholderia ferrariae TaxID=386056 RepID=UPI001FE0FC6F|nr:lysine 2,3-aminomutase [Paraburkholderia ferrariae]